MLKEYTEEILMPRNKYEDSFDIPEPEWQPGNARKGLEPDHHFLFCRRFSRGNEQVMQWRNKMLPHQTGIALLSLRSRIPFSRR